MILPTWRRQQIYKTAADFILQMNLTYPLKVKQIIKDMGITLIPYSLLTNYEILKLKELSKGKLKDGISFLGEKKGIDSFFIYYNDRIKTVERIRFTLAHELGHIILKHTQESELAEAEADCFAGYLLAPPELIHLIQPEDYLDVREAFFLSKNCASNAFNRYKAWLKKQYSNHFEYSEYEIKMINKFSYCLMKEEVEI